MEIAGLIQTKTSQGLIVKMETEIRAAAGGTVKQVLVREGDAVDAGHTLMTLG